VNFAQSSGGKAYMLESSEQEESGTLER